MYSLEKGITITYKFCYCLCANNKIAQQMTEKIMLKKYNTDNLEQLKITWQEFVEYYGFMEFYSENNTQKALLLLPPDLRCGVVLRDILRYDYSQIAAVLSISQDKAQHIVAQGRKKLKKYLKST